jgi:hypothetical protein
MECCPETNNLNHTSTNRMSTISTTPAMNTQKRKRTVVSYAELDQLPDLFSDDDDTTTVPCDESSGDESDNDDRTYSRNKVCCDPSDTSVTTH